MESLAAPGPGSTYFAASFSFAGVDAYRQVMERVDELDADAEPDAQNPSIAVVDEGVVRR